MYTNIEADHALAVIAKFLQTSLFCSGCSHAAIIQGLKILMRNNLFQFGDTLWHQTEGTAMGTPPAPPYATLYFGIHKLETAPKFKMLLLDYSQYIADVLGVWIHHPDPDTDIQNFLTFQASMNCFGKLKWEFTPLKKGVNFMDITLQITPRYQVSVGSLGEWFHGCVQLLVHETQAVKRAGDRAILSKAMCFPDATVQ
jgi:hypothetical protein